MIAAAIASEMRPAHEDSGFDSEVAPSDSDEARWTRRRLVSRADSGADVSFMIGVPRADVRLDAAAVNPGIFGLYTIKDDHPIPGTTEAQNGRTPCPGCRFGQLPLVHHGGKRVSFGPVHAGVIWLSDVICPASIRV